MLRLLAAAPLVLTSLLAASHPAAAGSARAFAAHTNVRSFAPVRPAASVSPAIGGPTGHIPCDLTAAYYMNGSPYDGTGVKLAIIDAFDQPNIASDLAAFDTEFGIPAPPGGLTIAKQGVDFAGAVPAADSGWGVEISLDVEWAHAIAPGASIALVEAADGFSNNTLAAVDYAVNTLQANIVSMSWGVAEAAGLSSTFISTNDSHFAATGSHGQPVMYLAAAGDNYFENDWPADSSKVIGVGGTNLATTAFGGLGTSNRTNCSGATGAGVNSTNETVWGTNVNDGGTGGGHSTLVAQPSWQTGFGPAGGRNIPDVAMLADPASGVAVYDTSGTGTTWLTTLTGGTSLATPLWAAALARVDQERSSFGVAPLSISASSNPLYSISASAYNDILTGASPTGGNPAAACVSALTCVAAAGYDMVTGRGSPIYSSLINALGGASAPGAPATASAVAGDKAARVTWSAAAANNSPIMRYTVTCGGCPAAVSVGGDTLSTTVTGLTNGLSYTFSVTATNAIGTGPATATNAVTPLGRVAPEAPTPAPIPTSGRTAPGASSPVPVASPRAVAVAPALTSAQAATYPSVTPSISRVDPVASAPAPVAQTPVPTARASWVLSGQLVGICDK